MRNRLSAIEEVKLKLNSLCILEALFDLGLAFYYYILNKLRDFWSIDTLSIIIYTTPKFK